MRSPWTSSIFRGERGSLRPERARGGLARLLLVVLLPLVLGPLLTVAVLLYRQSQANITSQVLAQLTALSNLKENQIDQWASDRDADMDNLATSPDILQAAQAFVLESQGSAGMQTAGEALQKRFDEYLNDPNNSEYSALLLARADTGEVVLASTRGQTIVGQKFIDQHYFVIARSTSLVAPITYDPRLDPQAVTIVSAAPVRDPQLGPIAVIMGIIPADRLLDIVAPSPGLGRTGRSYVITSDGYELGAAITPDTAKPDSLGIHRALSEQRDGSDQYLDPNDQKVIGIYNWLQRRQVALLVEESVSEAYVPLTQAGLLFAVTIAIAIVVSVGGVLLFTRYLTRPIQELTDGALRMSGGDLNATVRVQRQDEIGLLAQAFNSMVTQLRESYQGLEAKVEARTKQLAAAAEVGRAATSILNIDTLMARALELIRQRFNYYHASIFLLDEAGEYAVLRESTGEVGRLLKLRGHRLAVGSGSLIGWVTANRRPRIALDVGEDPVHFKNELLPDTRSEAAIPLRVGDRILGALDVQSREPNAFNQADIEILQILADQLAVAIENGRLFGRQQRIVQLEQLVAEFTAKIHQSPTFETIVESAATELGKAFGARRAVVRLKTGAPDDLPPQRVGVAPTDGGAATDGNGQH